MNENKVFCEVCRNDVSYHVLDKEKIGTLKDKEYNYLGKEAYCNECSSLVYVGDINDFNLKALYDQYRIKNNIISLEKIREICKKYDIGKRPFSLLLGWGENTFSRYYDGDMPTKIHSETLEKIYNDILYYDKTLKKNK